MAKKSINREFKDRLFKYIFGNEKHKNLTLSLYNAINNTHYDRIDDIEITTIENAVYMGMRNDISFIIAESMNLYEQQSTYNPNMPLRMLIYAGQLYDKYLYTSGKNEEIFDDDIVPIPYPKLIAFYNGDRYQPNKKVLMLSQAFKSGVKGDIQVRVTMYNVNYGRNKKLLNSCTPLSEYSLFTTTVRKLTKQDYSIEEAVEIAFKALPEDSEVRKLIEENKAGVAKMILFEYNEEAHLKSRERKVEERTRAEERLNFAKALLKDNVPFEKISEYTSLSIEELRKLK